MSERIPESIPTSSDKRSHRPIKRLALTPSSQQSSQIDALFANPDKEINTIAKQRAGAAPPPEIVPNVQGSSAGAGSGEFHVYKASRRREYDRLKAMEEDVKAEQEQEDFEREREEKRKRDEAKTSKNRAKRDKKKGKKGKEGKKESDKTKDGKTITVRRIGDAEKTVDEKRGKENEETEAEQNGVAQEEVGLTIHDDD